MPNKRQLSQKPENVRSRLRTAQGNYDKIAAELLEAGRKPIEEWDWEELAHGRPRDIHGGFRGRPPSWMSPAVNKEAARRLMMLGKAKLNEQLVPAIEVMANLMRNTEDDRIKLDAAKFIIEHVMGKAVAPIDVNVSEDLRAFIADALVLDDGQAAHPIIDGDYRDDDSDLEHLDGDPKQPIERQR